MLADSPLDRMVTACIAHLQELRDAVHPDVKAARIREALRAWADLFATTESTDSGGTGVAS